MWGGLGEVLGEVLISLNGQEMMSPHACLFKYSFDTKNKTDMHMLINTEITQISLHKINHTCIHGKVMKRTTNCKDHVMTGGPPSGYKCAVLQTR